MTGQVRDEQNRRSQTVGVIFTKDDLRRAVRMRNPPDLFELRLDHLPGKRDELEGAIRILRAPAIIAARHPSEGGANHLSARDRNTLLLEFLPYAAYVDVELRSAHRFETVLEQSRANNVKIIISYHDLNDTPGRDRLDEISRRARSYKADILKMATRTDNHAQLTRLREFFLRERIKMNIAAMGIGRLGRLSRIEFARQGSALNYAHIGRPRLEGQLSVADLRRILGKMLHLL